MARRAGAQRRQMPDRKVWPGADGRLQRPARRKVLGYGGAKNPGATIPTHHENLGCGEASRDWPGCADAFETGPAAREIALPT